MRTKTIAALVLASTVTAAPALAQLGKTGQFILSADRLFGLSFGKMTTENVNGDKTTRSRTDIDLLWSPGSPLTLTMYEIPRLSFDFVAVDGLTIGGSVMYFHQSGSDETYTAVTNQSQSHDAATISTFAFAPRVGYAVSVADLISIWPRVGITYYNLSTESTSTAANPTTTKSTGNGVGLDVEVAFAFSVTKGFGIVAGPVLDLPLSGSSHTETTGGAVPIPAQPDTKVRFTNYGLTAGLLGYF